MRALLELMAAGLWYGFIPRLLAIHERLGAHNPVSGRIERLRGTGRGW